MKHLNSNARDLLLVFTSILLGIVSYYIYDTFNLIIISNTAQIVADLFLKFLQLMSAPIIFLAIVTNFLNIADQHHLKFYGKRAVYYTIFTTLCASTIAYLLFQFIDPASNLIAPETTNTIGEQHYNYLSELLKIFPNNIVAAFAENNIIGVAIIAAIIGIAMMKLPIKQQEQLQPLFASLFNTFITIARFIITVLPIGIWSFTVIFCQAVADHLISVEVLGKYAAVVIGANLIQGFIILPLILRSKNLSPLKLVRSVYPALTTAFFSKSSSATLPLTMDCMIENHKCPEDLTRFTLPICTIINMNGCAAFIYTTVLFVAVQSGFHFNAFDYLIWIVISTLVAIGNASVPMGCYFLSSAILVGMGAPLTIMGLILPLYTFIDMIETALNVWSDCCVTDLVAKDSYTKSVI